MLKFPATSDTRFPEARCRKESTRFLCIDSIFHHKLRFKLNSFNVLLLAAGEGRRLRPLTANTPKCLIPILGKPLLWYWLELLKRSGQVAECWINTSYLHHQVEAFLRAHEPQAPLSFIVNQFYEAHLLGTAGTLNAIIPKFTEHRDLLLVHADNLSLFNLTDFNRCHQSRPLGCEISMLTFVTDNPQSCGIVEIDGQRIVTAFHEKVAHPPGNLANGAVYFLSPAAIDEIKTQHPLAADFSVEVLPHFVGRIFAWPGVTYHRDIGTPQSYACAQSEYAQLLQRLTNMENL
jgi:mannose-1-phosphate guanylyltransferase